MTTMKFEVRFAIDVEAPSPEQAATLVRDMFLDPDTWLTGDVRAHEFCEEADDWFPSEDRGVSVYFGDLWPRHYIYGGVTKPYVSPGVRPVDSIAWTRVK
jgi:hypothetical protein